MDSLINLVSKSIVITGAASGIGRETAIVASKLGASVAIVDISEDGLLSTMGEMEGDTHRHYVADLSDIDGLGRLTEQIISEMGIINGLVHCAGISSRKPLNVLRKDGFGKVMDINFYSFVELTRLVTKKKHFADGGSVVVMSSISSVKGYKAKTEYCVSKAAVDAFVRCMALELADRKIRVNSVMAAEVLTPLAQKARELNESIGVANMEAPLGPSEPYEVANTIAFLLSDATKTITGTHLLIDGGATV